MVEILLIIYFLGIVAILYSLTFHLADLKLKEYLMSLVVAVFWPIVLIGIFFISCDEEY